MAPPRTRYGNRVTALRWTRLLRELGHHVTVAQAYVGEPCDLLIALHARRSHNAIVEFRRSHPSAPLVLALTGTDLYQDLGTCEEARESLELASRLVMLQPRAFDTLPARYHRKARVIYQSVEPMSEAVLREAGRPFASNTFDVLVVGHLREVKDPFRTALAARLLPGSSRVRVIHAGGAMSPDQETRARAEMQANRRYHWLGEQPRWRVRRLLVRSQIFVLSSLLEGGANAVSEAVVAGTPVLGSRIDGNVGLLGDHYPGYFEVGDSEGLAALLHRAETDPSNLADLRARCVQLAPRFEPAKERAAWATLLEEISP